LEDRPTLPMHLPTASAEVARYILKIQTPCQGTPTTQSAFCPPPHLAVAAAAPSS